MSKQYIHLKKLQLASSAELAEKADILNVPIESYAHNKQKVVTSLAKAYGQQENTVLLSDGVLEIITSQNYGFLRDSRNSYIPKPHDIYVAPGIIKKLGLKTGHFVSCEVRAPKDNEKYFTLSKVLQVNFEDPKHLKQKTAFESLTPVFPECHLNLENTVDLDSMLTTRVIDLIAQIGKGSRALIVAPPKVGKTLMMLAISEAISINHPECYIIAIGIDERPEELTEMKRLIKGEVVGSTFDEPASKHIHLAEMVIEKSKRLVESGQDVVIILDSITRLARAYNTQAPSSGKVLTGGVDAQALQKPKRIFGAARNTVEGGSLTIIASALIETGSKMDEVIFEEFKGTGNLEIDLERKIAQKKVFPAINLKKSGTRREDLLIPKENLSKLWILRKIIQSMDETEGIEFLLDRLKKSKTNQDFFDTMNQ